MARGRQSIPWSQRIALEHLGPSECAFEAECRRLRLQPSDFRNSVALRLWAKRYRNKYYVPEELLRTWAIEVDVDVARI